MLVNYASIARYISNHMTVKTLMYGKYVVCHDNYRAVGTKFAPVVFNRTIIMFIESHK